MQNRRNLSRTQEKGGQRIALNKKINPNEPLLEGTTFGERGRSDEDSHERNERLYEKKNTHRRPHQQNLFSFNHVNHNSSPTLQIQNSYLRFLRWNVRSLRSHCYVQVDDALPRCKSFPTTLKGLTRVWFDNCHQIL